MPDDPASALPTKLADALRAELDEGEQVLWCGQPDARVMFRKALQFAVPLGAIAGVLAVGFLGHAIGLAFTGTGAWSSAPPRGDYWEQMLMSFFMGGVSGVFFVFICAAPFAQRDKARRTIHAVTPTRVLTIVTRPDGSAERVDSLEPGHPLHLDRIERGSGRDTGDVNLYPRHVSGVRALFSFVAISDARGVERLIRATFDPPAAAPPSPIDACM